MGHRSIVFAALWMAGLAVLFPASAAQAADESGYEFQPIFDGETLDGWESPDMSYWSVKDGAITAKSSEENPATENQFLVWQGGELHDFELKLRFRILGSERANSGIQFRSEIEENGHAVGYQADIDRAGRWLGALYDEHARGMLAKRGQHVLIDESGEKQIIGTLGDPKALLKGFKKDGWNTYHITARGNRMVLRINGRETAVVIDNEPEASDAHGALALQLHSGPAMQVQFKDIQLKRLPPRSTDASDGETKRVVFVSGPRSHGYGSHEHNAGNLLLAKQLSQAHPRIETAAYTDGWPEDEKAFKGADAIVMFCDGGGGHMVLPHLDQVDELAEQGVGIVCLHYAVEVPEGEPGDRFLDWIGGYFEEYYSVNPHWRAKFTSLPDHAITRGVEPFVIHDEWYYHMRFREDMENVTPILTAMPPKKTLRGWEPGDEAHHHHGNKHVYESVVKKKQPQHLAWAYERPNGGRGFGFTGAHFHWNWGHDHFRTLVHNAIAWAAKAGVPEGGVKTPTPTAADLEKNQDYEKPDNWRRAPINERIKSWNKPENASE